MEDTIPRKEHEEFRKRLDEENHRQNRRIDTLEENVNQLIVHQIGALTTSVEKLVLNMENMMREQEQHRRRLEALEGRDGEMWRKVTGYIITAVIGIVVGYIFTRIGM